MKTALITGIMGQDGSYLAELLLGEGFRVVGGIRESDRDAPALLALAGKIDVVHWDMMDRGNMVAALTSIRPNHVFNLAGLSSGAGMFEDPVAIGEINGLAVTRLLEAVREVDPLIRVCQASSSEVFALATSSPQSELTPRSPRSPYGAAKAYADSMVSIYRQRYGLFACSAILFNHESPRRRLEFVTRKITHAAASIKLGHASELFLGNLDARRDWGFAGDYVRAMALMLAQDAPDDYVVATGETHSVRDFCEAAFSHLGLDYRERVRVSQGAFRPNETVPLVGDPAKANKVLRWKPRVSFKDLVTMMVDADVLALRSHHGH